MLTMKGWLISSSMCFSFFTCSTCFSLITSDKHNIFMAPKPSVNLLRHNSTLPNVPVPENNEWVSISYIWETIFGTPQNAFKKTQNLNFSIVWVISRNMTNGKYPICVCIHFIIHRHRSVEFDCRHQQQTIRRISDILISFKMFSVYLDPML